jgi:hypothetical protein
VGKTPEKRNGEGRAITPTCGQPELPVDVNICIVTIQRCICQTGITDLNCLFRLPRTARKPIQDSFASRSSVPAGGKPLVALDAGTSRFVFPLVERGNEVEARY